MEKILFIAFTEADGTLAKPALEALTAAQALAASVAEGSFVAGFIGATVEPAAKQIGACGASKFIAAAGADFASPRYGTDAAAAEALCKAAQATIVICSGTSRATRCLPGVASRLQGRVDTHATAVNGADGKITINRWYYRQRMEAVLTRAQRPWVVLIDAGCTAAWQGDAKEAAVENVLAAAPDACKRTTVVRIQAPSGDQQTIRPDAEMLFVTGAGWTKKQADGQVHLKDAEGIILDFLKRTRASLGSSKSLVDLGGEGQAVLPFLSHLNQIGQTGSTPRHPKGLATCCHGEEPHAVGWRFISERRAINLDGNCGWARGKADVLYVADAFAVMQKVNAQLAALGK